MNKSLNMTKAEATENLYRWLGDVVPGHPIESDALVYASHVLAGRLPRPKVYSIWVGTSRSGNRTYRFLVLLNGAPFYLSRSIAVLLGMPFVETKDGDGIRRSYLDPAEVVAELSAKLYGDAARTPNAYKVLEHVSL